MMGAALVIVLIATAFVTSAPSWAFRGLIGLVRRARDLRARAGGDDAALALPPAHAPERGRPRPRLVERRARSRSGGVAHGLAAACASSAIRSRRASRSAPALVSWLDPDRRHLLDARRASGSARACRPRRWSSSSRRWCSCSRSSRATSASFQLAVAYPLAQTYNIDTARAIAFSIGLQMIEAVLATGSASSSSRARACRLQRLVVCLDASRRTEFDRIPAFVSTSIRDRLC